ncbi:hypothetical protein BU24DRAFT_414142 [Aaosphaeria arxii CBS 175.79]|uniref:Uncharacterized protein n=1 Tax=Aaosphaeria arxii CBS 175.79 TaxID=1450172 RepID=A0A6A5XCD0_9PLEO|nr:uncharacterized protein BU24DRAFT_414142 [Aaosphaeria arxii CBS 175.79]KAF2010569.1 hypothetical protein BU24DRAFT_414142 [Aaosphaeria arxii CBS 175.79]
MLYVLSTFTLISRDCYSLLRHSLHIFLLPSSFALAIRTVRSQVTQHVGAVSAHSDAGLIFELRIKKDFDLEASTTDNFFPLLSVYDAAPLRCKYPPTDNYRLNTTTTTILKPSLAMGGYECRTGEFVKLEKDNLPQLAGQKNTCKDTTKLLRPARRAPRADNAWNTKESESIQLMKSADRSDMYPIWTLARATTTMRHNTKAIIDTHERPTKDGNIKK